MKFLQQLLTEAAVFEAKKAADICADKDMIHKLAKKAVAKLKKGNKDVASMPMATVTQQVRSCVDGCLIDDHSINLPKDGLEKVVGCVMDEIKASFKDSLTEAKASANFTAADLKDLEKMTDVPAMRAKAIAMMTTDSKHPMDPVKVEKHKRSLAKMTKPIEIIGLMYNQLLSGEGKKVIRESNDSDLIAAAISVVKHGRSIASAAKKYRVTPGELAGEVGSVEDHIKQGSYDEFYGKHEKRLSENATIKESNDADLTSAAISVVKHKMTIADAMEKYGCTRGELQGEINLVNDHIKQGTYDKVFGKHEKRMKKGAGTVKEAAESEYDQNSADSTEFARLAAAGEVMTAVKVDNEWSDSGRDYCYDVTATIGGKQLKVQCLYFDREGDRLVMRAVDGKTSALEELTAEIADTIEDLRD